MDRGSASDVPSPLRHERSLRLASCEASQNRSDRVASEKFDKRYFEADGTTVLVKAEDL